MVLAGSQGTAPQNFPIWNAPLSQSAFEFCGITLPAWSANEYAHPEAELSLSHIKAIGANFIAVVVTGYMDGPHATAIRKDPIKTPSDESVVHILRAARAQGFQVMLKPHVDIQDNTWRGSISPVSVEDWFACYNLFIVHYARIAEKYGVELFCIATEFRSLSGPAYYRYWQEIIAAIRAVYSGRLTYAANWDEYPDVSFWNFLDYIGINAYFPLSKARTPSVEELVSSWSQLVTAVEAWQKALQKPVLFTEIGYRSVDFAAREPWHWAKEASYNGGAQANAYEAAFWAFWGKVWFAGMFWWSRSTDPQAGGTGDTGYTPQHKPALNVLRRYFRQCCGFLEHEGQRT